MSTSSSHSCAGTCRKKKKTPGSLQLPRLILLISLVLLDFLGWRPETTTPSVRGRIQKKEDIFDCKLSPVQPSEKHTRIRPAHDRWPKQERHGLHTKPSLARGNNIFKHLRPVQSFEGLGVHNYTTHDRNPSLVAVFNRP